MLLRTAALLIAGCIGDSTDDGTLISEDGLYEVDVAFRSPPAVGAMHADLDVHDHDGPVTGCTMTVDAMMPEHGHGMMGDDEPSVVEVGDGLYELSWSCMMAGHWELTTEMSCPGGSDRVVIDVDVD